MDKNKSHADKTSADAIVVAFDYQYYFFLWKVLSLRPNEAVGLEVKDDVHVELSNNEQVFFQIKHTQQKKKDGTPINLTASDSDLWKTISNWTKVVADKNDGRGKKKDQLLFLNTTRFVIASNKSAAVNNFILRSIQEYQELSSTQQELWTAINNLLSTTTDDILKSYIKRLLELETEVFGLFMNRIHFELEETDLLAKCKEAIKADKVPESKIDDVFKKLDSTIRSDNFLKIESREKIQITFEAFYQKYRMHYDKARSYKLQISDYKGTLPKSLQSQIFIQQLLEINDIQANDLELISKFTQFKLKMQTNMDAWLIAGEITEDEIDDFNENVIEKWFNLHRSEYRSPPTKQEHNEKGLRIIDKLRAEKLSFVGQNLNTDMSNGTFYSLSDTPSIGWREDWEKYIK